MSSGLARPLRSTIDWTVTPKRRGDRAERVATLDHVEALARRHRRARGGGDRDRRADRWQRLPRRLVGGAAPGDRRPRPRASRPPLHRRCSPADHGRRCYGRIDAHRPHATSYPRPVAPSATFEVDYPGAERPGPPVPPVTRTASASRSTNGATTTPHRCCSCTAGMDFARTFDVFAPKLAAGGWRVVSWDHRGHGDSDSRRAVLVGRRHARCARRLRSRVARVVRCP